MFSIKPINNILDMSEKKAAITIRAIDQNSNSFHEFKKKLKIDYINTTGKRLNESELISAIKNSNAVIAGTEKYTRDVIESSENLQVISRVGVGLDSVDLKAAEDNNIMVFNTPSSPILAVAEHTVALILSLIKNICKYNENTKIGEFNQIQGSLLSEKWVGIIGLGKIGTKVAELLECLGCKIIYYDPYFESTNKKWLKASSLKDLLNRAEIITLHNPPLPDNAPLLNRDNFLLCKSGSILINTARASLIDEKDLLWALNNGIIHAAGIDLLNNESHDNILINHPNVIITPHVASNTVESRTAMEKEAIYNILNFYGGRK